MTKPKFQFNLKTTLLLMAIAALAIFSYSQSVRIRQLEEQLRPTHDRSKLLSHELKSRVSLLAKKQKEIWDLKIMLEDGRAEPSEEQE